MASSDRDYYRKRAKAERDAAVAAKDLSAVRAHVDLAREYEWRAATEPYAEVEAQPLN
jgi:hypothetical protein